MAQSQIEDDVIEVFVLLFHLLVVGAALVSSPATEEVSHCFKNLVHPPHVFVLEVAVVDLQKPVVLALLHWIPVARLTAGFHHLPSACLAFLVGRLHLFRSLLLRGLKTFLPPILPRALNLVLFIVLGKAGSEWVHPVRQLHIRWFRINNIWWRLQCGFDSSANLSIGVKVARSAASNNAYHSRTCQYQGVAMNA